MQEGFRLKRLKNESRRVTAGCKAIGCKWRIHASITESKVCFHIKTLKDEHTCIKVNRNKDVTSTRIGKELGEITMANEVFKVHALRQIVLQRTGLYIQDYTLYRAKKYALRRGKKKYARRYSKLHRYGYAVRARDPGSYVYVSTLRYNPDINSTAHFHSFF